MENSIGSTRTNRHYSTYDLTPLQTIQENISKYVVALMSPLITSCGGGGGGGGSQGTDSVDSNSNTLDQSQEEGSLELAPKQETITAKIKGGNLIEADVLITTLDGYTLYEGTTDGNGEFQIDTSIFETELAENGLNHESFFLVTATGGTDRDTNNDGTRTQEEEQLNYSKISSVMSYTDLKNSGDVNMLTDTIKNMSLGINEENTHLYIDNDGSFNSQAFRDQVAKILAFLDIQNTNSDEIIDHSDAFAYAHENNVNAINTITEYNIPQEILSGDTLELSNSIETLVLSLETHNTSESEKSNNTGEKTGSSGTEESTSGRGESVSEAGETPTETVTLSWTTPTTRQDLTPLALSEIGGYDIIYFPEDGNPETGTVVTIEDASVVTYTTEKLSAGTYSFAIATFDTNFLYSGYSDFITVIIE